MSTPLLVLHRYGDAAAGAPWREALASGVWPGEWSAPDLPGHGEAPWVSDSYEESDLVVPALRHLLGLGWAAPALAVAVGAQCTAAKMLGLGGRAAGVALVDEFLGPWPTDMDESMAVGRAWTRGLADDPAAQAPAPASGLDPRTRHGCAPRSEAAYRAKQRDALPVPILDLPDGPPLHVLTEVARWWGSLPGGSGR